ncbi:MAG TPA: metallophosphoesterase [Lacrimispora saccharolytica]|nr:metallophosphoesterase [Lacrimispora saccharolytica]
MRVLIIADEESRALYDHYDSSRLRDVDLILSCGDLSASYLEFLVTMGHAPVVYIMGNHDDRFRAHPPEGCICVEERVFNYKGLRIAGLGGSLRYKLDGIYMYTEEEQKKRVQKLKRQIQKYHGIDVFLTHAPARGLGDGEDFPHRGFECFHEILDEFHPKYMFHGHQHLNYGSGTRENRKNDTRIINGYQSCRVEIGPEEYPAEYENTGSLIFDLYNKLKRQGKQ